jgi:hypothetical protein
MPRDPRVDAYIEAQADFARPILTHLRELVHAACPDCDEAIKWGMPAFLHGGKQLAGMAAFKAHATFGLWRGAELVDAEPGQANAMGQFGRLASIADLPPPDELDRLIKQALALAEAGGKPVRSKTVKESVEPPADLLEAPERKPCRLRDLRSVPARLPSRICRLGRRGEAPGNPRQADRPGRRVDGGKARAQLEVRTMLRMRP